MSALAEISRVEVIRRCELEAIVDNGLRTFVEVGQALSEIQADRLYRDEFATFEAYCAAKWDMSRPAAYRFIEAASVTATLSPIGDTLPATESVARELAPLKDAPELMAEAWAQAVEAGGEKPTAKVVREVVQQFVEPKAPSAAPDPRASAIKAQQNVVSAIAEKARRITELEHHLDLDVIKSINSEERSAWEQQLRNARTVLSQVIGALSSSAV